MPYGIISRQFIEVLQLLLHVGTVVMIYCRFVFLLIHGLIPSFLSFIDLLYSFHSSLFYVGRRSLSHTDTLSAIDSIIFRASVDLHRSTVGGPFLFRFGMACF